MTVPDLRSQIRQLVSQKVSIEVELEAISTTSALGENLVDKDGFPRDDLNVYEIRQSRQRQTQLINDHKTILAKIEKLMYEIHAQEGQQKAQTTQT